jgi:signal peptidase I
MTEIKISLDNEKKTNFKKEVINFFKDLLIIIIIVLIIRAFFVAPFQIK